MADDRQELVRQTIEASGRGDVESLRSILSSVANKSELVQSVNGHGETALHHACNRETAELLVGAVEQSQRRTFILTTAPETKIDSCQVTRIYYDYTALTSAVRDNRVDVVKYLCSLIPADEVLDTQPLPNHTPLHLASSAEVAKLLVESAPDRGRRLQFLLSPVSWGKETVLHEAVRRELNSLAEYLCSLNMSELILYPDIDGHTALHLARSVSIVKLLIESLPECLKEKCILLDNKEGKTALHMAAAGYQDFPEFARMLDYYSQILKGGDILCRKQDMKGRTPLHEVRNVEKAKALLKQVQDKSAYVNMIDSESRTALHTTQDSEIAKLLIDNVEDKPAYVKITDCYGRTALHYANSEQMLVVLLHHAGNPVDYINQKDCNGESVSMTICQRNKTITKTGLTEKASFEYKVLISLIEAMCDRFELTDVENAILATSDSGQNILHMMAIEWNGERQLVEQFVDSLEEIDSVDETDSVDKILRKLLVADKFGNTPLHYLAARFHTREFYMLCMLMPLWERRTLLTQRRKDGLNCLSILGQEERAIEYFMRDVFTGTVEKPYTCRTKFISSLFRLPPENDICRSNDVNLFKVMKCVLNEYPLLHGHQLLVGTGMDVASPLAHLHEQWAEEKLVDFIEPLLFHLDANVLSQQDMQNQLYSIDTEEYHGEPKVIVVTGYTSTPEKYLSPPGPDCIIISVIGDITSVDLPQLQTTHHTNIDDFLEKVQNTNGVQSINVNSTMRKHYGPSTKVDTDYTLVNAGCRGKALIICNKTGRDQWETEYNHAVDVLEKQLGLQVVTPTHDSDLSSDEMKKAVKEFSKSSTQSSLVVVSIMSHGDEKGNICCDGAERLIAVQEVADALCKHLPQLVTKLLILSFCRGPLGRPRHNRADQSWEDSVLPELTNLCSGNAVRRGVDPAQLERVRRNHPFPSVNVQPNCFILYSTLPDSMSFRYNRNTMETNKMFQEMSAYLSDFRTRHAQMCNSNTSNSRSLPLAVKVDQRSNDSSEDVTARTPHVELIYLFAEVASRVKYESQATQVLNFCYSLDKGCKPVHVEMLPL